MCSLSNLGEMDVLYPPIKFGGQIFQRWTTEKPGKIFIDFEPTSPFNFISFGSKLCKAGE